MQVNRIWITWESQRRSRELALALQAELYVLKQPFSGPSLLAKLIRYVILSVKTLVVIFKIRPKIVFAQNPSVVLAALLCLVKPLFSYVLVIDRHSNFKFHTIGVKNFKWFGFHCLSRFSLRRADLTIVTNQYLCGVVEQYGGRGFILPDKLPNIGLGRSIRLAGVKNLVCISSFDEDEPVDEILMTADEIDDNWILYITGDYSRNSKFSKGLPKSLPINVRFTGYLSEEDYQSLILSADILIVLTNANHTLNCGIYEGVALSKPLIVSDTLAIRQYFDSGVVYSRLDHKAIASSIEYSMINDRELSDGMQRLRAKLTWDWDKRFSTLCDLLARL